MTNNNQCGAPADGGPCILVRGHNIGQADIPDNHRSSTLSTEQAADALLETRRAVYGDRIKNMENLALIWSGLLGFEVKPFQVPLMMSASKMLRAMETPDYSDNIDDVDGWNKMFREVIGEDLVQARTVEEYAEIKEFRRQQKELADDIIHDVELAEHHFQEQGPAVQNIKVRGDRFQTPRGQ